MFDGGGSGDTLPLNLATAPLCTGGEGITLGLSSFFPVPIDGPTPDYVCDRKGIRQPWNTFNKWIHGPDSRSIFGGCFESCALFSDEKSCSYSCLGARRVQVLKTNNQMHSLILPPGHELLQRDAITTVMLFEHALGELSLHPAGRRGSSYPLKHEGRNSESVTGANVATSASRPSTEPYFLTSVPYATRCHRTVSPSFISNPGRLP